MSVLFRRWRGLALAVCAAILALSPASGPSANVTTTGPAPVEPNFDLGSRWTAAKVGKLVFDTSVTPHWMQSGDRFWYAYQTRDGRRFYSVDPVKKARAPLFDHAKMAASLTAITREPYDAQHLPFQTLKFKSDSVFEFDVQVPRDADIVTTKPKTTSTEPDADESDDPQQQGQRGAGPGNAQRQPARNRTLRFEYDTASGKLTLNEDYTAPAQRPRWVTMSPDQQTIVFARNHNLYMMDAENYAKALKNPNDSSIKETQITSVRAGEGRTKFTGIWMVEVDGRIFARSYNLSGRSWYTALLNGDKGDIKCGKEIVAVTGVRTADNDVITRAINKAYEKKYAVKEHNKKWVDGLIQPERVARTMEFVPA